MELIIARTAGFCMGVDMALHKLDGALADPPSFHGNTGGAFALPWLCGFRENTD